MQQFLDDEQIIGAWYGICSSWCSGRQKPVVEKSPRARRRPAHCDGCGTGAGATSHQVRPKYDDIQLVADLGTGRRHDDTRIGCDRLSIGVKDASVRGTKPDFWLKA